MCSKSFPFFYLNIQKKEASSKILKKPLIYPFCSHGHDNMKYSSKSYNELENQMNLFPMSFLHISSKMLSSRYIIEILQ